MVGWIATDRYFGRVFLQSSLFFVYFLYSVLQILLVLFSSVLNC